MYKYHGREVISQILTQEWKITDQRNLDYTYGKIYDEFVMGLDGGDNGISQYPPDIRPKYHTNTDLTHRVQRYNPHSSAEDSGPAEDPGQGFISAMNIVEEELLWQLHAQALIIYPAFEFVQKAFNTRHTFHPSGQLVYLEKGCPWKEHLNTLEESTPEPKKPLLFIICKDKDSYRIQGVPEKPGSFKCRLHLPESWRGLRDAELQKACQLPDAVFVHASGFVRFGKSLDSMIKMAEHTMAHPTGAPKPTEAKMTDVKPSEGKMTDVKPNEPKSYDSPAI